MIDVAQAAQRAGVHRTTIFRAIRRGELKAQKAQADDRKPSYFLDSEEFSAWLSARQLAHDAQSQEQRAHRGRVQEEQRAQQPDMLAQQALEVASKTLDENRALQIQLTSERERAARLERQVVELQYTMGNYQRALAEHAESLAEQRTMAQAERARAEQLAQTPPLDPSDDMPLLRTGRAVQTGWGSRLRRWLWGEQTG